MKPVEPNQTFDLSITTEQETYRDDSGGTYPKFRAYITIINRAETRVVAGEDLYDTANAAYDAAREALVNIHKSMQLIHPSIKVTVQ